jgi:PAS domain S-box-containing protein
VGNATNAGPSYRERLLREAVEEAVRLLWADGGMLYLADETTGELRAVHHLGVGPTRERERLAAIRLSAERGIVGPAVAARRPVMTGDYLEDRSFEHWPEADELMAGIGLRSFVVAPIIVEDRPFGALAIFSTRRHAFAETDLALVNSLAGHAAAEIANLELIERLARSESELAHRAEVEHALHELGSRLAALRDPEAVLQHAVDEAARLLDADGAGIELLDEEVGRLHWIYDSTTGAERPLGPKPGRDNVEPGQGVSWWSIAERAPVWTPDYLAETRFAHARASDAFVRRNKIRSVLAAPLLTETGVLGTLTVHSRRRDAFDADDGAVAGALATQASLAIQNARLIDQLARDLAERDRLEHELRDSEARYRYLLQSSPDGVWECDADGLITFWSDSARQLLGWTQDELLGQHWSTIVTPDTVPRGAVEWERMTRNPGEVVRLPLTVRHLDGSEVPVEISAVGIFPDGVFGGGHGLIRDVRTQVRLERDLRRQAAELASSRERANLARELHDSVTQALFSMGLSIGTIELLIERDAVGAREQLGRLKELQREALAEMRSLIFELRPGGLEEQGLVEALRRHSAGVQARLGLPIQLEAESLGALDPTVEEALFRIVQEALHNVVKHAEAGRVRVTLERIGDEISLAIDDDGRGFDPASVPEGHFGVAGMRSRAEALGGRLEVRSGPGAGTTVMVTVPARSAGERLEEVQVVGASGEAGSAR